MRVERPRFDVDIATVFNPCKKTPQFSVAMINSNEYRKKWESVQTKLSTSHSEIRSFLPNSVHWFPIAGQDSDVLSVGGFEYSLDYVDGYVFL